MSGQPGTAAGLDEMRGVIAALPSVRALPEAAGAAGPDGHALRRLAAAQGRFPPRLDRPRLALFAAAHGAAARRIGRPGPGLGALIEAVLERRAPVVEAAGAIDADLRLYELAWPQACGDVTVEAALSDRACAAAMAYGMMAVDDTVDLLAASALGDEGEIAAAALGLALYGGQPGDWAGADVAPLAETAAARHAGGDADPLEILRRLGGEDVAAIAGAVVAARFARIPVILDGSVALAAAGVLRRAAPHAVDHCFAAGADGSPGANAFRAALDLPAVPGAAAGDAGIAAVAGLRAALSRHLATS